jgi:hypothetical protein
MDKRQKEYEGVEKEVIVTADRSSNTGINSMRVMIN